MEKNQSNRNVLKSKHKLYFRVCFTVAFVILGGSLYFEHSWINCFPILFIVFFILMYAFNVYKKKLAEPCDYLKPLFIAVSISFAIVHFTFGVHSDVFASYNHEISNSANDRYKWFKTDEVLKFPISQLDFKNSPIAKVVDFNTLKDSKRACNIIIVDETASVKNPPLKAIVNDYMLDQIKLKFQLNREIIGRYNTSELMPPYLVSGLVANTEQSGTNDFVNILYYTGYKDINIPAKLISNNDNDHIIEITKLAKDKPKFIHDYFDKLDTNKKIDISKQKTSFNEIVN